MASAIEQMVGAVVSWKHWDAASPSGALRHLAISDAWLSAYFTRQSTINSARHYVGLRPWKFVFHVLDLTSRTRSSCA